MSHHSGASFSYRRRLALTGGSFPWTVCVVVVDGPQRRRVEQRTSLWLVFAVFAAVAGAVVVELVVGLITSPAQDVGQSALAAVLAAAAGCIAYRASRSLRRTPAPVEISVRDRRSAALRWWSVLGCQLAAGALFYTLGDVIHSTGDGSAYQFALVVVASGLAGAVGSLFRSPRRPKALPPGASRSGP